MYFITLVLENLALSSDDNEDLIYCLKVMNQYDYYRNGDYKRRSCSRSYDRFERDRYHERNRDYRRRSMSRSASHGYSKGRAIGASPALRNPSPRKSLSPHKASPRGESLESSFDGRSTSSRSDSPRGRPADSRIPSPRNSDVDVSFTF
ncbi:serine/arginine-rich splicing factor SC35-like [Hibiscus syriacus]|uniref:serine/arginine-rich splicing factor SC35-like n=1 Tax=Hibiscus syriacus TaxID=106335 RepID=UPI001920AC7D|nr:serine/arginine-rich splicing factor SC35-like [Hibiscus syriacus]